MKFEQRVVLFPEARKLIEDMAKRFKAGEKDLKDVLARNLELVKKYQEASEGGVIGADTKIPVEVEVKQNPEDLHADLVIKIQSLDEKMDAVIDKLSKMSKSDSADGSDAADSTDATDGADGTDGTDTTDDTDATDATDGVEATADTDTTEDTDGADDNEDDLDPSMDLSPPLKSPDGEEDTPSVEIEG